MMDELEEQTTPGVNFIPCIKWVRRGVAKANPERVKLTQSELAEIIEQTKTKIDEAEEDEEDEEEMEDVEDGEGKKENKVKEEEVKKDKEEDKENEKEKDFEDEYDMENYDAEDKPGALSGLGDLVAHLDPRSDPYLRDPDLDEDASDVEDIEIKATDNLMLVGHVEGSAAILEVYVYNDVEDALYVHHDILLPSYPLAMEWLSYEPGEDTKGNLVAVGTMSPVIDVWDLDMIDCLEPVFSLGEAKTKKKKKKSTETVGHDDAVLALAWNHHVEHVLASGSVDQTVLLWDLSQGSVASTIRSHKEKVQCLQWHPFEAQNLLTGCCDKKVRVFDCRSEDTFKAWKVQGEVEKVCWNHFNPFTFLVGTDNGHVQMFDVRKDKEPVWTLSAHDESINGMNLSPQCPDCLVTVSSDNTMKTWDISEGKPKCIYENYIQLGALHALDVCPDAPFVFGIGGDKSQDNLKVLDIRESKEVRNHFGNRKLENPLGVSEFGFTTVNEAETIIRGDDAADNEMEVSAEAAAIDALDALTVRAREEKPKERGGAAGKFKNKKKKKKAF